MNLRDVLQVWRRRWILTLLLLLAVLAVSVVAAMKVPRHYSAESDVALLPSTSTAAPNGHNPYLTYNSSLPTTAQIISYQLMDPHNVLDLATRGYTASFTAALAQNAAGAPILTVTVAGSDKTTVENTLIGVTNDIAIKLAALQTGIAPANRITVMTLSQDTSPSLSVSKSARSLVVVVVLGLVIALAIPLITDGASRRRIRDGDSGPASHRVDQRIEAPTSVRTPGGVRRPIPDEGEPTLRQSTYPPPGGGSSWRGSGQ
jgi:capsular polysaccharide biosynthesis protein